MASGIPTGGWLAHLQGQEPTAPHCSPALSVRHTETFLINGALPRQLGGLRFGRPQRDHTLPGHQADS